MNRSRKKWKKVKSKKIFEKIAYNGKKLFKTPFSFKNCQTGLWPILYTIYNSNLQLYSRNIGCGQSYKASTLVNYDSRVVSISNLVVIMTLECKMFIRLAKVF